jgi:hypothetical protein
MIDQLINDRAGLFRPGWIAMTSVYGLGDGTASGGGRGSWCGLCARWAPTIKRWSPNARKWRPQPATSLKVVKRIVLSPSSIRAVEDQSASIPERGRASLEEEREWPGTLLARRTRTIRMCSFDARSKGQPRPLPLGEVKRIVRIVLNSLIHTLLMPLHCGR